MALPVNNNNADSIYYVQTDLLGSWDRIVDGNKNVVQSSHFDPWGNRMSASDWRITRIVATALRRRRIIYKIYKISRAQRAGE